MAFVQCGQFSIIDFYSAARQGLDISPLTIRRNGPVRWIGQDDGLLRRVPRNVVHKVNRIDEIREPRHVAEPELLIVAPAHGHIA